MAAYRVQGNVTSQKNGMAVAYAKVEILKVVKIGSDYQVTPFQPLAGSQDITDTSGAFHIDFTFLPPPAKPSIVIRISQIIDGAVKYIYNEIPAVQTRWNIADVVGVNIKVEDDCIAVNLFTPPALAPYAFVFTRIGYMGVDKVSQASGLAYPSPPGAANADSNAPFGGYLHLCGWLGANCDISVDYYQIQYQKAGEAVWHQIGNPLYNTYYDFASHTWKTVPLGPFAKINGASGITVDNLYQYIKYSSKAVTAWQYPDLLAAWDTTKVQDGKYTIRIQGFKEYPPGIVNPATAWGLVPDAVYGTLTVYIDNSQPVCDIVEIKQGPYLNSWDSLVSIAACGKINLTPGNKMAVLFKAYDAKGFLRDYSLTAYYGHNQTVVPPPISPSKAKDDYSAHAGVPAWNGSENFIVEYIADTAGVPASTSYDIAEMPPCAYQFRLHLNKRTTNGFGLIYHDYEDTIHVTIERW
jgi:hypothetical protein